MRCWLILLWAAVGLAAEDAGADASVEYVSVPKSVVAGLDIEYFGGIWGDRRELEPSDDLRLLLALDDQEADALEALLLRLRGEFVAEVAELAEVELGDSDHLRFTLKVLDEEVAAVERAVDAGLVEILGRTRAELLNVARHDERFGQDRFAEPVFGPLYRRGRDRVSTVDFEAQDDGGWRVRYEHRRVALFGGTSSSTGHHNELPALERALARAVLQRHRQAEAEDPSGTNEAAEPSP